MNVITSQRTYASDANAIKALRTVLERSGTSLDAERWLIAVAPNPGSTTMRFVPVLVGIKYANYAHAGIMVVG